jgi:hypothetical protein
MQHFWDAGAGLRFKMCGYSNQKSALFKLRHLAHFEFYKRTVDGAVLNDNIDFAPTRNPDALAEPLIEQLFLVKGCKMSTMEVMMKFYRADATARRCVIAQMDKAKAAGVQETDADEDTKIHNFLIAALSEELTESRLYKYVRTVDTAHKQSAIWHYSGFTTINEDCLPANEHASLYLHFREAFPTYDAVLSFIVWASSFRVELATSFDTFNRPSDIDVDSVGDGNDDPESRTVIGANTTINRPVPRSRSTGNADDESGRYPSGANEASFTALHKKEKACLEYFLALIRLRSQKQLPYWAMLSPLAHHCKGYLQPGSKNPLIGAGCSIKTA